MQEIRLKRIALFILETLIIQGYSNISKEFTYLFNEFIYSCYRENKKTLNIIYDIEILEEFIKNNYEILSFEQMVILLERYHGFDGYLKLLDEVGFESASELNQLALLFIDFQQEIVNLYYADSNEYYPKGYPRIKQ